jgi:CubicO group peptidase (beta-lactamase class C family)
MPGTVSPPGIPTIDSAELDERDNGFNGLASTARDLAIFMQMLVNRGAYAEQRILGLPVSPAMTRPQLGSGVSRLFAFMTQRPAQRVEIEVPGGDYGYGCSSWGRAIASRATAHSPACRRSAMSALPAPRSGRSERELVGVYLSVSPRLKRDWFVSNGDLFQNAVHAAFMD